MQTKTAIALAIFCSLLVGFGFVGGVFTTLYALVHTDMELKKAGQHATKILRDNGWGK